MSTAAKPTSLPAILGGEPMRPEGPPAWPPADPEIAEALQRAFADGSWGQYHGPNCELLTERLAKYHACQHVQLCASGTVAVELALRGLNIGPGDEVILAAYDFKGNFQDVLAVGAKPVLVDVRADNWQLDLDQVADAVGSATRAVVVSHLHGGIVPMPAVMDFARFHGLAVVEDACQMPGAMIANRKAGTWGDVGVLSFGGSKLLSAGRGGAVLTDDAQIIQRIRLYTQRGNEAYPLSELQAAVLLPQLERLDERNQLRAESVATLFGRLSHNCGLLPFRNSSHNDVPSQPGYYKVGFQYDPAAFGGLSRELFTAAMRSEGIALDAGFRALHRIHSARRFRKVGELRRAADADERVVTLHHPVLLEGAAAMAQIVEALDKVRAHATMIAEKAIP